MSKRKTETLNIRLKKPLKDALKRAADAEQRSISNFIEHLISVHCNNMGIATQNSEDDTLNTKDLNA